MYARFLFGECLWGFKKINDSETKLLQIVLKFPITMDMTRQYSECDHRSVREQLIKTKDKDKETLRDFPEIDQDMPFLESSVGMCRGICVEYWGTFSSAEVSHVPSGRAPAGMPLLYWNERMHGTFHTFSSLAYLRQQSKQSWVVTKESFCDTWQKGTNCTFFLKLNHLTCSSHTLQMCKNKNHNVFPICWIAWTWAVRRLTVPEQLWLTATNAHAPSLAVGKV